MSGIRGKNTRPEILVRKALFKRGFRYRLHGSRLPGKPDMVFAGLKAVIFVHGCFWHGHDCPLFRWPSSRKAFWKEKITGNQKRDLASLGALHLNGWRTLVIWECALKGVSRLPVEQVMERTANWLASGKKNLEIRGETDVRTG